MRVTENFIYSALILFSTASNAAQTSFNIHAAHYDREFSNVRNTRTQTGVGIILRHQQPLFDNKVSLKGAAYSAQKLGASGRVREDLLTVSNGKISSFSLLGELSVVFRPIGNVEIEVGRVQHKSLFLQSKTRLLPSTFEGINLNWKASNALEIYAHQFTKWSPRANSKFQRFSTQTSKQGAIGRLFIAGLNASFQLNQSRRLSLNSEALNSEDYLTKLGVVATLKQTINETESIELKAAILSSQDAGKLFTNGAEDVLDNSTLTSKNRLNHDGIGAYVTASYAVKNHHIGATVSQFGDSWIEDNFDGDHGTTPFPSRTFGPELANTNETVLLAEYQYKWKLGSLKGLSTKLAYANGTGAENSLDSELGQAQERWWYAELRYRAPWVKGLQARVRYRDYKSKINGEVAGVASNRNEFRLDLNYKLTF